MQRPRPTCSSNHTRNKVHIAVSILLAVCDCWYSICRELTHFQNRRVASWQTYCPTNTHNIKEKVTLLVDSGGTVDLVFHDFPKASGSANHRSIACQLKAYHTIDKLVDCKQSCYKEGVFDVSLNGSISPSEAAVNGVPLCIDLSFSWSTKMCFLCW